MGMVVGVYAGVCVIGGAMWVGGGPYVWGGLTYPHACIMTR